MKALVVGYGSIGRRHIDILINNFGVEERDIFVLDLSPDRATEAEGAGLAIASPEDPPTVDICVISASTAAHESILKTLPLPRKLLYVEKPLGKDFRTIAPVARAINERASKDGCKVVVGYMLRHHPAVKRAKEIISSGELGRVLKYRAECGMYLPNWHPWEDYRSFYMSKVDGGGGALLDISHEIDLVRYLVGDVKTVSGVFGNLSSLECSSDDFAEMMLGHETGAIGSVSLDLIARDTFRKTRLVLEKGEVEIDFIQRSLRVATDINSYELDEYELDRNDLYIEQYKDALSDAEVGSSCSIIEGLKVMEIIEGVRCSSAHQGVVSLPIYSG